VGEKWTLNGDGACEPINPQGIATYGFVLKKAGQVVKEGRGLAADPGSAQATNNVAEYTSFLKGMEAAKELVPKGDTLEILGDSQLAIRQLTGEYNVNAPTIAPLYQKAMLKLHDLRMAGIGIALRWIPREENAEADKLSKLAVEDAKKADPEILKKCIFSWGKHKGKSVAEVPPGYMEWLAKDRK